MSDQAFERYKEALRQGHLAALRGDHAAAAAAYGEAGSLAPDRPLPHVGHGNALQHLGRPEDALAAYDQALVIAPLDEAALRGRGASLIALGRAVDAAATLTGLAESLEADGRTQEALDVAREALALASSQARFRLVARLSAQIRRGAGELVLNGGAASAPAEGGDAAATGGARQGSARGARTMAIGATLTADADRLADAGRRDEARERYVMAARTHFEAGRWVPALDACYKALTLSPADPDLHLLLAELYEARGWTELSVEKLVLLVRLADLTADRTTRDRACALATTLFPGDARVASICA